jgi:phosphate transport system substrate-binding protein
VSGFIGAGDRATLAGGGSTFAATMVDEWARRYRSQAPNVDVRYEAIGSGAGLRRLADGTLDFAVTEALMSPGEVADAGWEGAAQVPLVGGGVAVAYNVPGVDGLRLAEDTIARIFSGAISRWDHPAIRRDNPGAQLPSTAVTAVHRSDISGTTLAFTRYLARAGQDVWAAGAGTSIEWPGGRAAAGSTGVVAAIGAVRGSIGYVAAGPARAARLQLASVRNAAGAFVEPAAVAVDSALFGASGSKEDLTLALPDRQESPTAYPITVISHLVFRLGLPGDKDTALRHFGAWILSEGQRSAARMGFAPLPLPLLVRTLEGLQNGGTKPSR